MSNTAGSSTAGSRSDRSQRSLVTATLLLRVLPALRSLVEECKQDKKSASAGCLHRNGTKNEEIGWVSLALFILERHVRNIRQLRQVGSFQNSLSSLADCVYSFTGTNDLARISAKVGHWLSLEPMILFQFPTREKLVLVLLSGRKQLGGDLSNVKLLAVLGFIAFYTKSDCSRTAHGSAFESRSNEAWAIFSQDLARLNDQIQHCGNDQTAITLDRDQSDLFPQLADDFSDFISETFEAMTCNCDKTSLREMRFKLGTYKTPKSVTVDNVTILTKEPATGTWDEIRLHRRLESAISKDRENVPGQESSREVAEQQGRQQNKCICGYYQYLFRPQYWRLDVEVLGSRPANHWINQTRSLPDEFLQRQIDLKLMICRQRSTMQGMAKMTLSVLLAYSLFYLYGGPWSEGRWKRDHIIFFIDDNNKIPMRPFLKVPVSTQSNKGKEAAPEEFHRFPEFLELAIMLLEINFGRSLESILNMDQSIQSLNDSWWAASEVFAKQELDIDKQGLRDAIGLCLKPDFGMSFAKNGAPDRSEIRSKLLKHVVLPLEQDLERAFNDFISVDDLDQDAPRKILLPLASQEMGPEPRFECPEEGGHDTDLRAGHTNCMASSSSPFVRQAKSRVLPFVPTARGFTLFNDQSRAAEGTASELTDEWTQRFSKLVRSHISAHDHRRIKVAILDTGINLAHPEFCGESRIKELKSWTDGQADVDISGHGTHIASTILSLTLNVDVYVGKVAETNTLENPDDIAEAIRFACEEWDVDILSLSFGFPRRVGTIQQSLDKAVATNKVVFAAASNDGSNATRAFPASHDRVIAIHSADGHGNRSSFNPTPVQNDDNFCVVGEQLEGAWSDGVRRMSGTSFAVPVGVSIASFMIEFIRKNTQDERDWLVPLLSYEGVRAIFRTLSEERDKGYDLVNPLAHFSGARSSGQAILHAIKASLDG